MPVAHRQRTHVGPGTLVLLVGLLSSCGTEARTDAPAPAEDAVADAAPVASSGDLLPTDEGKGTVWVDGAEFDNFAGNCELSRRNGREEMGDIGSGEGRVVSVAIDNVASGPPSEMNFVALTDSSFWITNSAGRTRGTISAIAYESGLTPKGTSQALARVSFTGTTVNDAPVVAHVVCEIQNKF